jgi:hypothetical protein
LHHDNASKESFSSPLRDLGSELMLYSGIVTTERLRMVVNHETSKILRLCREVFAQYGGNDAWNVSAHYVYRKIFFFHKACMSAECSWQIPSFMTFRGYVMPKLYHVTTVTVYKLDGIEARTRGRYNSPML